MMKLTKSSLKEMIREVVREEKQLTEDIGTNWADSDVTKIVESIKEYK